MIFHTELLLSILIGLVALVSVYFDGSLVDAAQLKPLQSRTWDELYNLIFRFGFEQLSGVETQAALVKLNLLKKNLPADDPRLADVSFWIRESTHTESKCDRYDDEIIRLHLEQDKLKAKQQKSGFGWGRKEVLNLETFVREVRASRLAYCESKFDKSFLRDLTEWNMDNYKDIYQLTSGYKHQSAKNELELGNRVGQMISKRLDQVTYEELAGSLDKVGTIKKHYDQHSPCAGLLDIVRQYRSYYSLLTTPENYANLRPLMKNWVDKISVCLFIQRSPQVHENAAEYVLDV